MMMCASCEDLLKIVQSDSVFACKWYTPASNLSYLALPGRFLKGAKMFIETPECETKLSKSGMGYVKCMISMATPDMILKNGDIPTNQSYLRCYLS